VIDRVDGCDVLAELTADDRLGSAADVLAHQKTVRFYPLSRNFGAEHPLIIFGGCSHRPG
jgi:hypothetical protein